MSEPHDNPGVAKARTKGVHEGRAAETDEAPAGDEALEPSPAARRKGKKKKASRDRGDVSDRESARVAGERAGAAATAAGEAKGAAAPDAAEGSGSATDAETAGEDAVDDAPEERLVPEGNPLRLGRGPIAIVAGSLLAFVVMAIGRQFRWGVPIGALGVLVATFGVLDLLGTFDDSDERLATRLSIRDLASPLALLGAGALGTAALVMLAVDGRLAALIGRLHASSGPAGFDADSRAAVYVLAALIPAAFLVLVVGVYRVGDALDAWSREPDGSSRPLLKRHGFWLVVLTTVLYLPMLGSHSLSDPWETHYGEVSREILSRNDWISLWWAQDGWFWSKPVLNFWIQAIAMATFGVRYKPGAMLSAVADGRAPWPEWAVRLPIFLLTLLAGYLLYKAVAHVFGRRAGLLGGIVLLTMPQWFLVTHQTMTDMPFVATMAATMALFLIGAQTDPDREIKAREIAFGSFRLRVSAYHLVIGVIVASVLPQALYLLSRNLEIRLSPFDIKGHLDSFMSGSAGNCLPALPGNEPCRQQVAVVRGLHPALQGLIWLQALAVTLYMSWGERRVQRLLFLAAWYFAALSTMAKGPAGFGLPALAALVYVVVTKRYRDLLRMEIVAGCLILLAVAMPWFVAMYARHGQPFTDRLLFHDMFKRAFTHVHDTNEGDDTSFRFYVWQLGYAMFPWTGLVPAGLVWWMRRREDGPDGRGDASVLLAMWFVFAFALFSLMLTKFHHYILPAVPPAAMLTGVLLDDMLRRAPRGAAAASNEDEPPADPDRGIPPSWRVPLYAGGVLAGVLAGLYGVSLLVARVTELQTMGKAARVTPAVMIQGGGALVLIVVGVAAIVTCARILGRGERARAEAEDASASYDDGGHDDDALEPARADGAGDPGAAAAFRARYERLVFAAIGVVGAGLVYDVGRDMAQPREGQPSQIRLLHLFTYNYKRPWPASLDFGPALWAFAIGAAVLTGLLVVGRWRRHVVAALLGAGVLFAAWGIDVYFVKTSPHWGQRETMIAYQRAAKDVPGPIVAYQMNWKGENFYTGNAVPAFVSSGKKFTDWVLEEKKKGLRTFYFVTEHGRTGSLQNELGNPTVFEKLTTPELNNKFVLVRAKFE